MSFLGSTKSLPNLPFLHILLDVSKFYFSTRFNLLPGRQSMLSSSSCSIYSVYVTIQCPFKTATQKITQIFVDIKTVYNIGIKKLCRNSIFTKSSCGQQDAIT